MVQRRPHLVGAVVLMLAIAAPALLAEDAGEREKLVGVWKGYVVEGAGEQADRGPVQMELTITGAKIRGIEIKQREGGKKVDHGEGDYTLDLTAAPHRLDATQINPGGRKALHMGIYSVEGDTLKWCVTKGRRRPTAFETGKGSFLLILKREKPGQ